MENGTVKKENHLLRSLTAIFMMFVAGAHYYSHADIDGILVNDVIYNFGRFVIPIMVLISGYFCYSKDGHTEAHLGRKMLHILYLVIFYKVFYLAFSLILALMDIVTFDYVIEEFLLVSPPFHFNTFDGQVRLETTQPIWFLYALLAIYVFWFLLYHFKIKFRWSAVIAVPILILALLFGEFLPLMGIHEVAGWDTVDIGGVVYPFITLPFFVIGYYMHKYREQIDILLSDRKLVYILVFGIILMCAETWAVGDSTSIYLGTLIVSLTAFYGTFRVPDDKIRIEPLIYIGRNMSVWMYVFFGAADFIIRFLLQAWYEDYYLYEVAGPFIAVLLDILMAFIFVQILKMAGNSRKKKTTSEITS